MGELPCKVRGQISWGISPFEQKALGGVLTHEVPNSIRRYKGNFLYIAIPLTLFYIEYKWFSYTMWFFTRKEGAEASRLWSEKKYRESMKEQRNAGIRFKQEAAEALAKVRASAKVTVTPPKPE